MSNDEALVRKKAPATRDCFAEFYVAASVSDRGWNVYFPHRDKGFDFIITKEVDGRLLIRPVQVRGCYPEERKGDCDQYGFTSALTATHPDMVVAIAFFAVDHSTLAPEHIAYMPLW